MSSIRVSIVLFILAVLTVPVLASGSSLALTLGSNSVLVRGVSQGGNVYLYGVSRDARGTYTDVVPRGFIATDDNGDGLVTIPIGVSIAPRSIWIAVDDTTSIYAIATPAEYTATQVGLSSDNLRASVGSAISEIAFEGDVVHFMVVRPGVGMWQRFDALGDTGGTMVATSVGALSYGAIGPDGTIDINAPEAPQELIPGDVVFMVNSFRAEYGVSTVEE